MTMKSKFITTDKINEDIAFKKYVMDQKHWNIYVDYFNNNYNLNTENSISVYYEKSTYRSFTNAKFVENFIYGLKLAGFKSVKIQETYSFYIVICELN